MDLAETRAGQVIGRWNTTISGTGEALDWHPSGLRVAYAGGRSASVLTTDLRAVWHEEFRYPSDVSFSPTGELLAVGDWSKGAVFAGSGASPATTKKGAS